MSNQAVDNCNLKHMCVSVQHPPPRQNLPHSLWLLVLQVFDTFQLSCMWIQVWGDLHSENIRIKFMHLWPMLFYLENWQKVGDHSWTRKPNQGEQGSLVCFSEEKQREPAREFWCSCAIAFRSKYVPSANPPRLCWVSSDGPTAW